MSLKNPNRLSQLGTLLVWVGVLAWAPFIALRIAGQSPSLWVYLPFHLAGVIGGSRLRTAANNQLGKTKGKRTGYRRVAHLLLIASILVWIPYSALKISCNPVQVSPFLTAHLFGIFSGIGMLGVGSAVQYFRKVRTE